MLFTNAFPNAYLIDITLLKRQPMVCHFVARREVWACKVSQNKAYLLIKR